MAELRQEPSLVSSAKLCPTCSSVDLWTLFGATPTPNYEEPVSWDIEIVREQSYCPLCKIMTDILDDSVDTKDLVRGTINISKSRYTNVPRPPLIELIVHGDRHPASALPQKVQGERPNFALLPLAGSPDQDDRLPKWTTGRRIAAFVDISLLENWLNMCDGSHLCNSAELADQLPQGFRLIDVVDDCLVQPLTRPKYFALSYVWGDWPQPMLTVAIGDKWYHKNALPLALIPNSIVDAMHLVKMLGGRYLWVDSLCIVQDDRHDWFEQVEKMDVIYNHAYATIVAAAGNNCNAGLLGVPPERPRRDAQSFADIGRMKLVSILRFPLKELRWSKWNSRGWTLQEKLLSRRTLIFMERLVAFRCGWALCIEDMNLCISPDEPGWTDSPGFNDNLGPIVSFGTGKIIGLDDPRERFKEILALYTIRQLSKPEDFLPAFKGITKGFASAFGRDHFGFPSSLFHVALLWRTSAVVKRRPMFPSWSWAGWYHIQQEGRVDINLSRMPLLSIYHFDNSLLPLSSPEETDTTEDLAHAHFKNHADELRDQVSLLASKIPHLQRLIFFYTSSAMLAITDLVDGAPLLTPLVDQSRRSYNVVIPNSQKLLCTIELDSSWVSQRPRLQEFIVVGYFPHNSDAWINRRGVWFTSTAPGYRLMLIEWVDGVAYRVQNTRNVNCSDWWLSNPQRKLIFLG